MAPGAESFKDGGSEVNPLKEQRPAAPSSIRHIKDGPFFWGNKQAVRKLREIAGESNKPSQSSVLAVYLAIAEIASDHASESFAVRRGEIASRAGVNIRTVDAAVLVMVKARVLHVERRRIDATTNLPSVYTLLAVGGGIKSQGSGIKSHPSATLARVANRLDQATRAPFLKKDRRSEKKHAPPASPSSRASESLELLESLAKECGLVSGEMGPKARGSLVVALKEIIAACPDVTPADIAARAATYPNRMPGGCRITPHALAKHWALCGPRPGHPAPVGKTEPAGWRDALERRHPGNAISSDLERSWASVDAATRAKVLKDLAEAEPAA